jgi:hypothetical protein
MRTVSVGIRPIHSRRGLEERGELVGERGPDVLELMTGHGLGQDVGHGPDMVERL